MDIDKLNDMLTNLTPAAKNELLHGMVNSLLSDLGETEKKKLLQTVLVGRKESRELATMVEH